MMVVDDKKWRNTNLPTKDDEDDTCENLARQRK